jgi:hypothetical protein
VTDYPATNTHVHLPPNFSAFASISQALAAAQAEGVRAVGISNFYDQRVYPRFARAAAQVGVFALFGLEFITLDQDLEAAGVRVNDPANPGRMYLTGKGIVPARGQNPEAAATTGAVKRANDQRATQMVAQVAAHLAGQGLKWDLTAAAIAADVAARADVPVEWVSLQERHIARAIYNTLAPPALDPAGARGARRQASRSPSGLEGLLSIPGGQTQSAAEAQGAIRAKLLKRGTPGFVPEVPLTFAEAYSCVTAMGGIPCYPVLADGADPVCPFEQSPDELAAELVRRQVHAAEFIPVRNAGATVDRYVRAFEAAGLIVVAGTEHNTPDLIPLTPAAQDGPLSDHARAAFWRGATVVAAHQHLAGQGRDGYTDRAGARTGTSLADLAALGAQLIGGET